LRAYPEGPVFGAAFAEVQLLDDSYPPWTNLPASNKTGGLYSLAPVPSAGSRPTAPPDQWNRIAVVASGRRIQVTVNGMQVTDANLDDFKQKFDAIPGLNRTTGRIGLQMHGTKVEFRNIRVREPVKGAKVDSSKGVKGESSKKVKGSVSDSDTFQPKDWYWMPEYWKVNSQQILGSTGKDGIAFNTFVCSKTNYRNFELSCQVCLIAGNTGIQFRSNYVDQDRIVLQGPQADAGAQFRGGLHGEETTGTFV